MRAGFVFALVIVGALAGNVEGNTPNFEDFTGVTFFGHHPATDTDTIASALGAAEFFKGFAARPAAITRETQFVLDYFGIEAPPLVDDIFDKSANGTKFCLVDFNNLAQLTPFVRDSMHNLVCIFDHHVVGSGTISLDVPAFVEVRPWGSCSTIIASKFLADDVVPSRKVAGALLGGILSDTINLNSPTTTEFDRWALPLLAAAANVANVTELAFGMFDAKSNYTGMTPREIVLSDFKLLKMGAFMVGFGSVDTVRPAELLARKDEFLEALVSVKAAERADYMYIGIIGMLEIGATVLCAGEAEVAVAVEAWAKAGAKAEGLVIPNLPFLSRKTDFLPGLRHVLENKKGPEADLDVMLSG